jgi:uncharacterized repeat protein (TIGR03803 family)
LIEGSEQSLLPQNLQGLVEQLPAVSIGLPRKKNRKAHNRPQKTGRLFFKIEILTDKRLAVPIRQRIITFASIHLPGYTMRGGGIAIRKLMRRITSNRQPRARLRKCAIEALEERMLLTSNPALTPLATFNYTGGAYPQSAGLVLSGDDSTLYGTTFAGGIGYGTVFSQPVAGGAPTVLATFNGTDGSGPFTGVILSGGTLYGTTDYGGADGDGEVFSLPASGGTPTVLASFNGTDGASPQAGLILSGGTLYSTTDSGGADSRGEVFSVPVTGGTPTVLASFNGSTNGDAPNGLVLSGSALYGTTEGGGASGDGEVFSLPVTGGVLTVLASFNGTTDGDLPDAGLILSGSTLYGTTELGSADSYGTIFSLPLTGGTPTMLTSFDNTDGAYVEAGVILSGSTLYGTASSGGALDAGTVFSLPATGGTPTVLASFDDGPDGESPEASLILFGSTLYGTTNLGGAADNGEVFSVPTAGGTPTVLTSFNDDQDGSLPAAGVLLSGSTLYGTTFYGGSGNNDGEVFSVPITGGLPTVLASFNDADGIHPEAGLILSGSTLYGTTSAGGSSGDGELFSLPVTGGTPTVLTSFDGADGETPDSGLILSGPALYGTTGDGGANDDGEVFSLPLSGGTPTVLGSFNGADGSEPTGNLTLSGSTLYGTTASGGADGEGEIFSLPKTGGTPTVLASFNGTHGQTPYAGVILSASTLYGTTVNGGADADGTVFSLPVSGGTPAVVASFNGTDGSSPYAGLLIDGSGNLYGTTLYGGANSDGTVFEVPAGTNTVSILVSFDGANGDSPQAGLIADTAGNLYGTTETGGASSLGNVFELSGTGFITDAWTGAVSDQWNNSGNWSNGAVPGSQDNVAINGAAVVASTGIDVASLTLNGATLQLAGNSGASTVSALTISSGGVLDITNNALTINYANGTDPNSTILSYLSSGSNDGAWNGNGIISSTAAGNSNYGVGYADGADGVEMNLTSGLIEVAYVQYGDITLSGLVNANDFHILSTNFAKIVTDGWEDGDFAYGGTVNAEDFHLLASNFGQTQTGEALTKVAAAPAPAAVAATIAPKIVQSSQASPRFLAVGSRAARMDTIHIIDANIAATSLVTAQSPAPLMNDDIFDASKYPESRCSSLLQ